MTATTIHIQPPQPSAVQTEKLPLLASPTKKKNRGGRPRSRVTFSDAVPVREIDHVGPLSEREKSDIWYGMQEYALMRSEVKATTVAILRGHFNFGSEHYCARGLEARLPQESQRRSEKMTAALMSVFREQEQQFFEDVIDVEAIARAAAKYTRDCGLVAIRQGKADAEEAARIHGEGSESTQKPLAPIRPAKSYPINTSRRFSSTCACVLKT